MQRLRTNIWELLVHLDHLELLLLPVYCLGLPQRSRSLKAASESQARIFSVSLLPQPFQMSRRDGYEELSEGVCQ
jgi:hypothetical protein